MMAETGRDVNVVNPQNNVATGKCSVSGYPRDLLGDSFIEGIWKVLVNMDFLIQDLFPLKLAMLTSIPLRANHSFPRPQLFLCKVNATQVSVKAADQISV